MITEKQFQAQLITLAKLCHWDLIYHPWLSIHSARGFFDLVLFREEDKRLIFAELKSEKGVLSKAQQEWLDALKVAGCEVYLWRPSDFEKVVEILKRPTNR